MLLYKYHNNIKDKVVIQLNTTNKYSERLTFIEQKLIEKDCTISDNTILPIKNKDYVYYHCNKHMDIGEQKTREDSFKNKEFLCKRCRAIHLSKVNGGSNSGTWKGGLTSVRHILRSSLSSWVKDKIEKANYRCELTGKEGSLEVHHLESFEIIVNRICSTLDIELSEKLSEIEINRIKDELVDYHYKNNEIGVVLLKSVHKKFHKIYGLKNTTEEQFQEFKKLYPSISKLESNIRPEKRFSTSKYVGVTRTKNGTWQAYINHNRKNIAIGSYPTEYRAVVAYNNKAIELKGKDAKLNNISGLTDKWIYEDSYYHFKEKGTSIYTGVTFSNGNWRYEIHHNKKKIFTGSANSELEAVYLYNKKKIELLGDLVVINFLTDEEIAEAERRLEFKYEYYEHKKTGKSIYTNVFHTISNKWGASIRLDGKLIVLSSTCSTDRESAELYNRYVLENDIKKKLNKIID